MDEHNLIDRAAAAFSRAVFTASDLVFGPWTIALLFGTGIFLTLRLRFVQVVRFARGARGDAARAGQAAAGRSRPSRRS